MINMTLSGMSEFKKDLLKNLGITLVILVVFVIFWILFRLNILLSQSSENLSLLIQDWEVAKNYRDQVSLLVPDKDDLVSLNKDFQIIAQKSGVNLNFSFGSESSPSTSRGLGMIGFSATVDGNESSLFAFFKEIEKSYYSMKINSLDITNTDGKGGLRMLLSGQIFFVSE